MMGNGLKNKILGAMNMDVKREIIKLSLLLGDISDLQVFVDYAGHVNTLSVRVFRQKEEFNEEAKWRDTVERLFDSYFNFDLKYQDDVEKFKETKQFLQNEIDKRIAV